MSPNNQTPETCFSHSLDSMVWQTLKDFSVDQPGAQLTFVKRLARENRWSLHYAQRVFDEYKKFVFLAVAAGHKVTPSDEVDQAWHLHLAYTESYWTEMCDKLLRQPLHHGPTKGGQMEDDKYLDWYGRTLESYQRVFGHRPPADIWPEPEKRFDRRLRFARLNAADYWMVKKPDLNPKRIAVGAMLTLVSSLTLSACVADSPSGAFLLLIIIAAVAVIGYTVARGWSERKSGGYGGGGCSSSGCGSDSHNSGDSGGDGGSGSSGCGSSGCGGGGCGGGCGS